MLFITTRKIFLILATNDAKSDPINISHWFDFGRNVSIVVYKSTQLVQYLNIHMYM